MNCLCLYVQQFKSIIKMEYFTSMFSVLKDTLQDYVKPVLSTDGSVQQDQPACTTKSTFGSLCLVLKVLLGPHFTHFTTYDNSTDMLLIVKAIKKG